MYRIAKNYKLEGSGEETSSLTATQRKEGTSSSASSNLACTTRMVLSRAREKCLKSRSRPVSVLCTNSPRPSVVRIPSKVASVTCA
ncbi:hypothetical protein LIER_17079 [Lithospermum erythrorhizon]|uniref:Uncharacterized protein n=1 Tax=Lithospermum erythrorhizon TaxID=34254 RepID=A0AAV3QAP7_LITER